MNKLSQLCSFVIMMALFESTCVGTNLEVDDTHPHRGMTLIFETNNQSGISDLNEEITSLRNQITSLIGIISSREIDDMLTIVHRSYRRQQEDRGQNYFLMGLFSMAGGYLVKEVVKKMTESGPIRWGFGIVTTIWIASNTNEIIKMYYTAERKRMLREYLQGLQQIRSMS
ncbi:hypothetical protein IM40_01820 [Candidatus Paracaedimonas acanthamoebae]|nr:hypothetical protein IM40_01820 [Candidatus Paracaedimonas acanthamoebae]